MGKHSKNNIISLSEARHASEKIVDFNEAKHKIVIGKHSKPDADFNASNDYDKNNDYDNYENHEDYETHTHNEKMPEQFSRANDFFYRTIMSSIVVVLVLILVFFGVRIYDTYVVEDIQIVGNDLFEYFEIIQYSGIEYRQSMLSVNEKDTIAKIESEKPMLEVESIEKTMPNTIVIVVKERKQTCYLVLKGSQKCAIIGEDNVCLDIVDSYLEDDIPMVQGLDIGNCELGQAMEDADARKLIALDAITATMVKHDCMDRFSIINLSNTTNIVLKTSNNNTIKIGDTSNMDNKMTSIIALLNHLDNTLQTDKTIVVTGDNAIYTEQNS